MAKEQPPDGHARIDAAEVTWVDIAEDGMRLCLRLSDRSGRPASVSLPVDSLNAVLTAVLRARQDLGRSPGEVHTVDGWSLAPGETGLLLTLQLPDGAAITFAMQAWQIAAMASLASQAAPEARGRLN